MKIKGVSIWIWIIGLVVISAAAFLILPKVKEAMKPAPLEIVKDELWKAGDSTEVRGKIFNPRKDPARNVKISYRLSVLNVETNKSKKADPAIAEIQYIPPGQTVDFTASSDVTIRKWDVPTKDKPVISEEN